MKGEVMFKDRDKKETPLAALGSIESLREWGIGESRTEGDKCRVEMLVNCHLDTRCEDEKGKYGCGSTGTIVMDDCELSLRHQV